MVPNLKHCRVVIFILCFITCMAQAQGSDTLRAATVQEKSEMIALRMAKELGLSKEQSQKINQVLIERFQYLEKSGSNLSVSLETADRKALQKLTTILNNDQYSLYQKLRAKKQQDKEQYLKDHPGFVFLKEDIEMDF